jgi:hypothetical protein
MKCLSCIWLCIYAINESQRLATGWEVQGSNAVGGETFLVRPDWPRGHPSCRTMSTGLVPGGGVGESAGA